MSAGLQTAKLKQILKWVEEPFCAQSVGLSLRTPILFVLTHEGVSHLTVIREVGRVGKDRKEKPVRPKQDHLTQANFLI